MRKKKDQNKKQVTRRRCKEEFQRKRVFLPPRPSREAAIACLWRLSALLMHNELCGRGNISPQIASAVCKKGLAFLTGFKERQGPGMIHSQGPRHMDSSQAAGVGAALNPKHSQRRTSQGPHLFPPRPSTAGPNYPNIGLHFQNLGPRR